MAKKDENPSKAPSKPAREPLGGAAEPRPRPPAPDWGASTQRTPGVPESLAENAPTRHNDDDKRPAAGARSSDRPAAGRRGEMPSPARGSDSGKGAKEKLGSSQGVPGYLNLPADAEPSPGRPKSRTPDQAARESVRATRERPGFGDQTARLPGGTPARPPQAPAPESKGRVADENTRITREPTPPQRPASARAAAPAPVQEQSDVTDIEEFKRAQKPPPPARDEEEEHTAEFKHPQTRVETIENQRPREADEAETTGPVAKPQSLQPRPPVGKSGQLSRPQLIVAGVVAGLIVAIAIAGYVQSLSPSKRDLMNLYIAGFNGEKVDPPVDKIAFDLQSKEPCRTHSDDRCFIYKVTAPRYTGAMIVFKGAEDWEREKDANASKR